MINTFFFKGQVFVSSVQNLWINKTHEASVLVQHHSTDITGESVGKGNFLFPEPTNCPASTLIQFSFSEIRMLDDSLCFFLALRHKCGKTERLGAQ